MKRLKKLISLSQVTNTHMEINAGSAAGAESSPWTPLRVLSPPSKPMQPLAQLMPGVHRDFPRRTLPVAFHTPVSS